MSRLHWEDLPAEVRDALCRACGPVVKAETATEGIMPGLAVRLHLEDGSCFFCKAIAEDHPAAFLYHRQEWAGRVLPARVPTPRLVWSARTAGWIVLVHEYLDDARCADLTPGSPDLPAVIALMRQMTDALTPCPRGAPSIGGNLDLLLTKARLMLDRHAHRLPAGDRALYEAALNGFDPAALDGDTLIHYETRPEPYHDVPEVRCPPRATLYQNELEKGQ